MAEWFEAAPCTCTHRKEDHDINGCRHSYLSKPACKCSGVFGQVHTEKEYQAAMEDSRQYLEALRSDAGEPTS